MLKQWYVCRPKSSVVTLTAADLEQKTFFQPLSSMHNLRCLSIDAGLKRQGDTSESNGILKPLKAEMIQAESDVKLVLQGIVAQKHG